LNYYAVSKIKDGKKLYWFWQHSMWTTIFSPACLSPMRGNSENVVLDNARDGTVQIDKYKIVHQGRV
jgi:hypothetical protein